MRDFHGNHNSWLLIQQTPTCLYIIQGTNGTGALTTLLAICSFVMHNSTLAQMFSTKGTGQEMVWSSAYRCSILQLGIHPTLNLRRRRSEWKISFVLIHSKRTVQWWALPALRKTVTTGDTTLLSYAAYEGLLRSMCARAEVPRESETLKLIEI
jgi:hypothetical protein